MSEPVPPQPAYILRGHQNPIHALCFLRNNSRLVTGDAEGWVVVWSLASKRPVAVWRAHEGCILGLGAWRPGEGIITHGKDNKLIVWKFDEEDEAVMSTVLPADDALSARKNPWLLHILHVNTLNFCKFGHCEMLDATHSVEEEILSPGAELSKNAMLVAVPNTLTSEAVDIFHLPSEKRIHTVQGDKSAQTGMVMAVSIFHQGARLTVVVGYESGHTMVSQQVTGGEFQILYLSQPHTQPVLSLGLLPDMAAYYTSSADAIIAKHPIYKTSTSQTSHGLSSPATGFQRHDTPQKVVQTKHSGQQGLVVRSDGKLLATAGWDSKVRVYTTASVREVAVLKWHNDGCYAVAFADLAVSEDLENTSKDENPIVTGGIARRETSLTFRERRTKKAERTHWLAAGSKDGKVSLWDIY